MWMVKHRRVRQCNGFLVAGIWCGWGMDLYLPVKNYRFPAGDFSKCDGVESVPVRVALILQKFEHSAWDIFKALLEGDQTSDIAKQYFKADGHK